MVKELGPIGRRSDLARSDRKDAVVSEKTPAP